MTTRIETATSLNRLIQGLSQAVRTDDVGVATSQIKEHLQELTGRSAIRLPESFRVPGADSYARRLVHHDSTLGYTVVAMTWGPGQGTQLHDHAGMWCVECVLEGDLEVTQYDVAEQDGDRYRFERKTRVRAGVGDAGCLIPPFEYHVLRNAHEDRSSISLHVYRAEMDCCNLYVPRDDGWWDRQPRQLAYDE